MPVTYPQDLLLGDVEPTIELTQDERAALMRRHNAALKELKDLPTEAERLEMLRAVVWPSDDFLARVEAGDERS